MSATHGINAQIQEKLPTLITIIFGCRMAERYTCNNIRCVHEKINANGQIPRRKQAKLTSGYSFTFTNYQHDLNCRRETSLVWSMQWEPHSHTQTWAKMRTEYSSVALCKPKF
ncbi:hypothetical protein RvY_12825 [Ramazzottius varieornatus]|uniref:Uncharacterized protein n=1 Tax=Ramazzottius varieornatus TaxID=947166 RepID=A0A1D1VPX7_RAMVA|nr:hypothetical protein RvY_12825 [Ramazzottius varieornatus]